MRQKFKMKKIIYFSHWGYPRGARDRTDFLLETLSKKYLVLECGGWETKSLFKVDLRILEMNDNLFRIRILIPRLLSFLDKLFKLPISRYITYVLISLKLKCDIIIIHGSLTSLVFALFLLKSFKKIKLIIDMDDLTVRMGLIGKKIDFFDYIKIILNEVVSVKLADKILTLTNFGKYYLASISKKSLDKFFVLPELVKNRSEYGQSKLDIRKALNIRENDFVIIWSGIIRDYQVIGLLKLIYGLSLLENSIKERIVFLIAGASWRQEFIKILENYAKKSKVNIMYLGPYDRNKLFSYLSASNLAVHVLPKDIATSFITGIKLSEYLSIGIPILGSNLAGIREVIGDKYLFNINNPEDIKCKIQNIVTNYGEAVEYYKSVRDSFFNKNKIDKLLNSLLDFIAE
jgi:glycosyltransferase involved in cell wall biosynthesis